MAVNLKPKKMVKRANMLHMSIKILFTKQNPRRVFQKNLQVDCKA